MSKPKLSLASPIKSSVTNHCRTRLVTGRCVQMPVPGTFRHAPINSHMKTYSIPNNATSEQRAAILKEIQLTLSQMLASKARAC